MKPLQHPLLLSLFEDWQSLSLGANRSSVAGWPLPRERLVLRESVYRQLRHSHRGNFEDCDCQNCRYVRRTKVNMRRCCEVGAVPSGLIEVYNEALLTFPCLDGAR